MCMDWLMENAHTLFSHIVSGPVKSCTCTDTDLITVETSNAQTINCLSHFSRKDANTGFSLSELVLCLYDNKHTVCLGFGQLVS